MSRKTVTRSTAKQTAKAEPTVNTAEQVGEILGRLANALLPNSGTSCPTIPEPAPAPDLSRELFHERMDGDQMLGEYKEFASRCCAMLDAINTNFERGDVGIADQLSHVLEEFVHRKYEELAQSQSMREEFRRKAA